MVRRDPGGMVRRDASNAMTIRLLRLATGPDGQSHFSDGTVAWASGEGAVNAISAREAVATISFEESAAGSALDWHNAPCRQYVITLSGTLLFETRLGATETIRPGDVLLAEDTAGGGHRWRLVDGEPWRRVYVTLA
jgi:quercetin dioxygenase-like cupin family protein